MREAGKSLEGVFPRLRAARPTRARAALLLTYSGLMFDAAGPFCPWVTSKETFWPSFSDL